MRVKQTKAERLAYIYAWQKANPDKVKASQKRGRQKNKASRMEYNRVWCAANPDRVKERNKKYYDQDADNRRKKSRHYYQKTKHEKVEENRARANAWNKANPGRANDRLVQWKKENPEANRALHVKRRGLKRGASGSCSGEQLEARASMFGNKCAYCVDGKYEHADHVISLSKGGFNWAANMRPACAACNTSKGNKDWKPWIDRSKNANSNLNFQLYVQIETEIIKMNLPSDMAAEVGKARSAGGGVYIVYGTYVFMIKKWFYQKIQDRCIILEAIVVEGRKKIVMEGDKQVDQEPNAFGSEVSSTANFDGDGKLSAPANARAPILGLFGFKENEVKDDVVTKTLDEVIDASQPAAGMLVSCSTFPKEIRSRKGNYITGLTWECLNKPGEGLNAPALVAARNAAMSTGGAEAAARVGAEQLAAARANGAVAVAPPAMADKTIVGSTVTPEVPAVPSLPPPVPVVVAAPPPAPRDPFMGWTKHPTPGYWYQGQIVKSEADLLAGH